MIVQLLILLFSIVPKTFATEPVFDLVRPCASHLPESAQASRLYSYGEMAFALELQNLDPKQDLELRIELTPLAPDMVDGHDPILTNTLTFRPSSRWWLPRSSIRANGTLAYEWSSRFDTKLKKAIKAGAGNLWLARLAYTQGSTIFGRAEFSFLVAPKQSIFVQVKARPYCLMQGRPEISAEPIVNRQNTTLSISRETSESNLLMDSAGFTLGVNPSSASSLFLTPATSAVPVQGWLFADWKKTTGRSSDQAFTRSWTLSPYDSAIFVDQKTTQWLEASLWEIKTSISSLDDQKCTTVRKVTHGIVALERTTTGLYSIPESLYPNARAIEEFILAGHPLISTCSRLRATGGLPPINLGDGSFMTFYKTYSLSGDLQ